MCCVQQDQKKKENHGQQLCICNNICLLTSWIKMPENSMVTRKRKRFWFGPPLLGSTSIDQQSLVLITTLLLLCTSTLGATSHYYMDNKIDCSLQGFIEIPSHARITVTLRSNTKKEFDVQRCELKFQAQNKREFIKLEFPKFYISSCSVVLSVNDNSFKCGQSKPRTRLLDTRQVSLVLNRDLNDNQYNADIIVSTYKKDYTETYQDEVSNPTLIGIIVGVVCGIIFIILIIAIAGHCYYKSMRKKHHGNFNGNGRLDDCEQSSIGIGYINEGVKNGGIIKNNNSPKNNDRGLLSPDEEVKQFYDEYIEEKKNKVPNMNNLANGPKKSGDFDNDPVKTGQMNSNSTPKSPVLSALQSSPKFQASFKSAEAEAEERSNRFSQGSTAPPTPPPLPTVPTSPQMQRSQTNTNHAGIRRVPKISASSEDMEHLEREITAMEAENRKNQILPNNPNSNPLSPSKIVPVPIAPNLQSSLPLSMEHPTNEQPTQAQSSTKDSSYSQHTLRPTRAQDKKKQGDITDAPSMPPRPQKAYKEKDSGTNSLRKRGHKIPKFPKGKPFMSESEGNFLYGDDQANRSDTPLSEVSSRMARTDENESLPPLQRTTSRQSLFASRTSLYGRRGKRERRPSVSESVTSYAHDDLDMYMPSVQQDPMDRRDARIFKSLGDITKAPKEISYQDQTKKHISKKNAHKKPTNARKSSSSTQTIEQKGTQTEPSRKKNPQSKETTKSPIEMPQSQFQPISKASDVECSGNQYLDNVPKSLESAELTKPSKSPWELLCELTDAEMKMRNGSLPSGNAALYNSDYPSSLGGQSRPSIDNLPAAYHPSISSQVSDRESYAPAYSPVPVNYPPSVASNLPNNLYPRKSSWEALKELTDAQLSYSSQGASESIV